MARSDAGRGSDRAAVAVLIFLGFSLQLLQVGIIPLLPLIGKNLHISPGSTSWLVTASLLSGAICLAVLTRLADLIGKRRVVLICLGLVLAGSILGLIASDFATLVVSRVLMGAVLPMLALPEAIAADTMPRERGQVTIGAIHTGTGLGIAGGLLLGALAGAGHTSWRAFFAVGVIACVIGIVATLAFVRESPARATGRLDVVGAALISAGLIGVLLAFSEGPTWGWGSIRVVGLGVAGLGLLAAWSASQARTSNPLISLRQMLRPEVRIPYVITFLVAFGIYGALTAISRLAQMPAKTGFAYGFSALQVGWYAIPQALGSLAGVLLIRRLVPRDRLTTALLAGTASIMIAFVVFGILTRSPGLTMVALLFDSAGLAVTLAAAQIAIVRAVGPEESGIALGLSVILYALGNTVGSAVLGVLFTSLTWDHTPLPSLAAFRWGFALSGLAAALALGLCVPQARLASSNARESGESGVARDRTAGRQISPPLPEDG